MMTTTTNGRTARLSGRRTAATLALAAALTATVAPAAAQAQYRDYRHNDRDGISAGEIIAGAVILGGLAAILSDNDNDRYRDGYRYDPRYAPRYGYNQPNYGYNYQRYGNSRQAVNQCVNAVERTGTRYGRADVTEIRDIDRRRDGYTVEGRVVVRDGYRGRWGQNRGGYYDKGRFRCEVRYGRVQDVRFSGLG